MFKNRPGIIHKIRCQTRSARSERKGVLVGLTEISEVSSTKIVNGESVPADGELFYRGYNVKDLIAGLPEDSHFGFEECTYLLLFGKLPRSMSCAIFRLC